MDLLNALDRYYPSNSSTGDYDEDLNDVVDFIQETLECCGVNNTGDWLTAPYFEETNSLPSSCCDGEPQECLPNDAYDKVSTYKYMWFMVLIKVSNNKVIVIYCGFNFRFKSKHTDKLMYCT